MISFGSLMVIAEGFSGAGFRSAAVTAPIHTSIVTMNAPNTSLRSTKVILLTASAQQSDINAGLVAGADFYLTKPFSPRDLLARLDEALEL